MLFEKTLLNKQIIKVMSGAVLMGAIATPAMAEYQLPDEVGEGELIIVPKAGLSDQDLNEILKKHDAKVEHEPAVMRGAKTMKQSLRANLVKVPKEKREKVAKELNANPHIEYAEVNRLVELESITANDPKQSWHLNKMNLPEAWSKSKGKGVVVAVLDTGVNTSHEDLKANLLSGYNVVSKNTNVTDTNGHGTKVAGVVAAVSNNNKGVASIAWDAKVLPVKISNRSDGVASLFDIARALTWAADNGADIANVSYQISDSSTVKGAAKYFHDKGGLVVAAAGNSGKSMTCTDNEYVITVSATTSSDGKASFSNYGKCIDVAAPGQGLATTTKNGSYGSGTGTSFAAPATAGVLALLKAANPKMSNKELESLLENNADNSMFSGSFSTKFGYGRIDAGAALRDSVYVPDPEPELDQTAPEVSITSPKQDSEVNGLFSVDVNAADNEGVKKVELYFNGQRVGADFSSPYSFSVDSSAVADGEHTLTAIATDTSGNVTETANHYVVVNNAEEPVTPD
ncbi:peptidase S8, partial [Thalassotalea litorea]